MLENYLSKPKMVKKKRSMGIDLSSNIKNINIWTEKRLFLEKFIYIDNYEYLRYNQVDFFNNKNIEINVSANP